MARILAYTSPARGHLFPAAAILLELARRGHQIHLRTLPSEVEQMRALGLDAAPIATAVESIAMDDWQAGNSRKALARAVDTFARRAEHDGPDLRGAIDEVRPDAVLVDINSWGAQAAAEAWAGPWATFCPYPLPLRSADTPPYGPGFPPATGVMGRVRDALAMPLVMGMIERTMLPQVNRVRAATGLSAVTDVNDMLTRAPLLLYLTAEPFEYRRRDWHPSILMVGPCEWNPTAASPDWLDTLDRPVALVTTSSEFQDDARLAQAALDALAGEDLFVVATMPAADASSLRVPANARVERFVPHSLLLDRAVVAITHGGMGATQKALARGVPVCAVPFGRDQFEVARRVEVAGAGSRLPASRLSVERLRSQIHEAMTKGDGARRVAEGFAAAGGAAAVATAVEKRLLGNPASELAA
jgi:MGT family glycosyltransferase